MPPLSCSLPDGVLHVGIMGCLATRATSGKPGARYRPCQESFHVSSKDSLISRLTLECASRQIAPPNTVGSELFAGARRRLGQLDEYRRSLHRRPGLSEHRPAQARGEQRSFSNVRGRKRRSCPWHLQRITARKPRYLSGPVATLRLSLRCRLIPHPAHEPARTNQHRLLLRPLGRRKSARAVG
jgi:hypothetical protein